jgi:hypothetical protein
MPSIRAGVRALPLYLLLCTRCVGIQPPARSAAAPCAAAEPAPSVSPAPRPASPDAPPATAAAKREPAGPGEIIEIHDPVVVPPKQMNPTPRRAPPYSDEAVERDAWVRAWVLLDVSPDGVVAQFKFLNRPGYKLEPIVASEVFRLRFAPGLDRRGRPIHAFVIWGIEWVSAGWLTMFRMPRSMMPPTVRFPPRSKAAYVPCRGSGPLNLESLYPVYRDCSTPDLSRAKCEPWVVRPSA